jgi:hypothetical protein
MKRMLALLIVLSLLLPAVALAQDKQVVTFDDPVLEAVIRGLVRVPEGDVTADKLAKSRHRTGAIRADARTANC